MRVGIQTIDRDVLLNNYGSFFQHCALRMVLKRLGNTVFRCESISFKGKVKFALLPLLLLRTYAFYIVGLKKGGDWRGWWRMLLLVRFVLDYWRMIGRVFESQTEADAYLAGGDSVWCSTSRTAFLLDKPSAARRISFAASSAWEKFSNRIEWITNVKEVVATYFAVGVREETGATVIKAIGEPRRIAVVLDPVMLLNSQTLKGMAASRCAFKKNVLLCYVVNVLQLKDMNLEALKSCAEALSCDLKVVGIQGAEDYIPWEYVLRPSPREFLAMMRDAKYVVTNSFHGIVFSLQFNKQFAFIEQTDCSIGDHNCRQNELLTKFGMMERRLGSHPVADQLRKVLVKPIDYDGYSETADGERERCLNWLKENLS